MLTVALSFILLCSVVCAAGVLHPPTVQKEKLEDDPITMYICSDKSCTNCNHTLINQHECTYFSYAGWVTYHCFPDPITMLGRVEEHAWGRNLDWCSTRDTCCDQTFIFRTSVCNPPLHSGKYVRFECPV